VITQRKTIVTFIAVLFLLLSLLSIQHVFAQDFRSLFKQVDSSVVTIHSVQLVAGKQGLQTRKSVGTGVVIDSDGSIMTAAHVVHTADQIGVKFKDGTLLPAKVVSSVSGADVALIKIDKLPSSATVARLGDSENTEPGEPAFVIGTPFGIEHALSIGHISGIQVRPVLAGGTALKVIQTDASVNPGNSGGPLFNENGEVVGIVSHILSEGGGFDGVGFAIAINEAREILLEQSPFWTGFEGLLLPEELATVLNVPQKSAILIQRVNLNSVAAQAGLKGGTDQIDFRGKKIWVGGDIILEIHDTVCDCPISFSHLRDSLKALGPDKTIGVKVLRGGKVVELQFSAGS